jgi:hypothetical protein
VLAFEESAIGTATTVIKGWILRQRRALAKVTQGGIEEGRAKAAVRGGAELVQAERGGGESERGRVMHYHSLCLRAAVLEFGV